MEEGADILHSAFKRAGIEQVALRDVEPRIGDIDPGTRGAHQHAHLFPGLRRASLLPNLDATLWLAGIADVHLHQVVNVPKKHVEVDQTSALQLGLTQQDVAQSVLVSLSGSFQTAPKSRGYTILKGIVLT